MRPSRRPALLASLSLLALLASLSLSLLVTLGLFATSGCRRDLCLLTFKAVCACENPSQPELKSCVASYEVVTCDQDAGVDPCASANCCGMPPDAGKRDGTTPDDGPPPDGNSTD